MPYQENHSANQSGLQKPVKYTLRYYTLMHIIVHIFLCVFGVLHVITPWLLHFVSRVFANDSKSIF